MSSRTVAMLEVVSLCERLRNGILQPTVAGIKYPLAEQQPRNWPAWSCRSADESSSFFGTTECFRGVAEGIDRRWATRL